MHTWPERKYAAFDVFMCGKSEPEKAVEILQTSFNAKHTKASILRRGEGRETEDIELPFEPEQDRA